MQKIFQFKQFMVHQGRAAMPVTTDACILGAIADFNDSKTILDIGAGTGLLSLMLAQRFPEASITAVEKDKESYYDTQKNFTDSTWLDRLYAKHGDIIGMEFVEGFDGIICNPPFFENQLASEDSRKSAARHTAELNYESLSGLIKKHLNPNGTAWVLIPALHEQKFRNDLADLALYVKRSVYVKATIQKAPHVLVLHIAQSPLSESTEEFITYDAQGFLSPEAQKLLREFYLQLP